MVEETIVKLETAIRDLDLAIANTEQREQSRRDNINKPPITQSIKLPKLSTTKIGQPIHFIKSQEVYNRWHQEQVLEKTEQFLRYYYDKKAKKHAKQLRRQIRRTAKQRTFLDEYNKTFVSEKESWKSESLNRISEIENSKFINRPQEEEKDDIFEEPEMSTQERKLRIHEKRLVNEKTFKEWLEKVKEKEIIEKAKKKEENAKKFKPIKNNPDERYERDKVINDWRRRRERERKEEEEKRKHIIRPEWQ